MEKLTINLQYYYDTDLTLSRNPMHFCFNSIDDLKRMIYDPTSLINLDEEINSIKEGVEYEKYVDDEGNEVSFEEWATSYDEETDTSKYTVVNKTPEEIEESVNSQIEILKKRYNMLKNGEYEFNELTILFDYGSFISFEDMKEAINLTKDRIKTLDIPVLNSDKLLQLAQSVNIDNSVGIRTRYNFNDYCTRDELIELTTYLNRIQEYVKRYGLSPLETCIFVHDLIRERQYKKYEFDKRSFEGLQGEELKNAIMELSNSRSLFKIFKSDKIVCAGFSNLYAAILELLGIKSDIITYESTVDDTVGHMSNLVYLNDEKYNINGIYEIDTTWGRKYNKDDSYNYQESINNYFNFARPINEAIAIKLHHDEGNAYNKELLALFSINKSIERLLKFIDMQAPNFVMHSTISSLYNRVEELSKDFNRRLFAKELNTLKGILNNIKNNNEYSLEELKRAAVGIYMKVYKSQLDPLAFKKALYKVKYIEHSIDKDKYPFNAVDFNKAFKSRMDNEQNRLIFNLFGERMDARFKKEDKLNKARAELISVLHKAAQDDVDKNPVHHI